MSDQKYKNPTPVVDCIVEVSLNYSDTLILPNPGEIGIVLIERKNEPHGWALPGGFVNEGESLYRAAEREVKEETQMDVVLTEQFFTYSEPDRDPRQHNVSTVFIGQAAGVPTAADDAKSAWVVAVEHLAAYNLVFDHKKIVYNYLRWKKTGVRPGPLS